MSIEAIKNELRALPSEERRKLMAFMVVLEDEGRADYADKLAQKIDDDFQSVDEVVCEGLRLLQQQEAWEKEARRKIDIGWEQAKAGQLRTPDQAQENLAARKEAWKDA